MTTNDLIDYILHLPREDQEEIYNAIKEVSQCAGPVVQMEIQVRKTGQPNTKITLSKEEAKAIRESLKE